MEKIKEIITDIINNSSLKMSNSGNKRIDYMVNLGDTIEAIRDAYHAGLNQGFNDMKNEHENVENLLNELI